jgi:hypothetical protein
MKRVFILMVLLFLISLLPLSSASAAPYIPLISEFPQVQPDAKTGDFAGYVNFIIQLVIGLTGILAVLMIIVGGIQYVSTDSWTGKDSGKKRIQAAVGGLILALSSFLILNSIDPSLTYLNFAKSLKPGGDLKESKFNIVAEGVGPTYDTNESGSLDPTGTTGGITSGNLETNSDADSCAGLSSYRSSGYFNANDKGGTEGSVIGEVAWLMQVVPQKWPGLRVMSSYRSLKWNLTSAYGVSPARADQIIADFNTTDGSYTSRVSIANKYNIKRAALTSNHVMGKAVDFAGPGLSNGQVDQLVTWARSNTCLRIGEVLWKVEGHYDHVHLGV